MHTSLVLLHKSFTAEFHTLWSAKSAFTIQLGCSVSRIKSNILGMVRFLDNYTWIHKFLFIFLGYQGPSSNSTTSSTWRGTLTFCSDHLFVCWICSSIHLNIYFYKLFRFILLRSEIVTALVMPFKHRIAHYLSVNL